MKKPTVCILLATYNGKEYVQDTIESLLSQDYEDIHVVMSDDRSVDGTDEILDRCAALYPDKLEHYRSGVRFGSAQKHFMHLVTQFQNAPYIMFCDQDDIWHRDKVSKTLDKMLQTEENSDVPTLIHTDLRVVNHSLEEIAPSFCLYSGLDGEQLEFRQLLVQNVVTGCTVMINRKLAGVASARYAVDEMIMHDWWLALLAAGCGRIAFIDKATIDYRQHGCNAVGAKNVRSLSFMLERLKTGQSRKSMQDTANQAKAFFECYSQLLSPANKELAAAMAATAGASMLKRNRIYIKYKLFKRGLPRLIAQLLGL